MRNSKSSKQRQVKKASTQTSNSRTERIGSRFYTKEMNQLKKACKKAGFENLRDFILTRCSN